MKESIFRCHYGIFDVDGTLLNSMPIYLKHWKKFWKKFWLSEKISEKLWNLFLKIDKLDYLLGSKIGTRIIHFCWKIAGIKDNESMPFPGAKELLKKLVWQGVTLFASSGSFSAAKRLKRTNLAKYFSMILGGREGTKEQHIEKIAKCIPLPPHLLALRSLYVADTPNDMKIAKKFGFYTIGIANKYSKKELLEAGADEVVEKIEDLLN